MSCTEKCWTRVDCTVCGRWKEPSGRSVPLEAVNGYCDPECPGYAQPPEPPHLWGVHDSARHYTDPEGWAAHVADCEACKQHEG